MTRTMIRISAMALAAGLWATEAVAQDHSWLWPLYTKVDPDPGGSAKGEPRPAVWGGTGEYQYYGDAPYMHPGSDIRGDYLDPVVVPVDSTILATFKFEDECVNETGASCRAWFRAAPEAGRFLYYVSHIYIGSTPEPGDPDINTEVRSLLEAAVNQTESTTIDQGTRMAVLADFKDWWHLHIGVFDTHNNYALMHAPDFFEIEPAGSTGESLLIVDDESPMISSIELVNDGALLSGGSAIANGECGPEVSGNLDIIADIHDTFYTTGPFNDFPGKSELNPVTNVRRASYRVRRVADGEEVASELWFDHHAIPLTCGSDTNRNCILEGTTPTVAELLDRLVMDGQAPGAPDVGGPFVNALYELDASKSEYWEPGGERYFHILTNAGGVDRSWDTNELPNGRYQITVEASDFAGNAAARSMFVSVRQPGTVLDLAQPGFGDAYMKDHANDIGAIPSNAGGQPFWESPDIFVVPQGTPVSVDGASAQSLVTEGVPFDVYVRVRNDGCTAVEQVQVQVFSADPAAINTNWRSITAPEGQFIGDGANPEGVSVPAGSAVLVGPFPWVPTAEEAQGDGHRCLLAAATAPNDVLPPGAQFDAPNWNNVAQRNLRVSGCEFQLSNPDAEVGEISLRLVTDAAVESTDEVELTLPFVEAAYAAWSAVPTVSVRAEDGSMIVRLRARDVTLPGFDLAPGAVLDLSLRLELAGLGSRSVQLAPEFNGAPASGFSCYGYGQPQVPR